jgi:GT2 family glycosyltransferase
MQSLGVLSMVIPARAGETAEAPVESRFGVEACTVRGHHTVHTSIVIVTFNHREVISRCLDALQQTLGADSEVLVIDNASSDGTPDLIRECYPWVTLVRSDTNDGFGAACNRGAAQTLGEYLVFLNPDTEPQPGWLEPVVDALETLPRAGMATPKILLAQSPEHVDAFGNEVHISGLTTCRGWGQRSELFQHVEEVSAISGACFAIRKDLFHSVGGFDERYFLYYEDTDLSLRVRFAGYRCVAVPQAKVLHDHRPGFSPAKLRYLERNRWWTLLKLLDLRTMLALVPVLVMAEALAWGVALVSGPRHLVAKGHAWLELIASLPMLPRTRVAAREVRTTHDPDVLVLHVTRLRFGQVSTSGASRKAEAITELLFGVTRLVALGRQQWPASESPATTLRPSPVRTLSSEA